MAEYTDNYFTNDSYAVRTARLEILKNYIEYWAPSLNIPRTLVNWGLHAAEKWKNVLGNAKNKKLNSENFYSELRDADEKTFKYYLRCKRLLLSTFLEDKKKNLFLGIGEKFPRNRSDKIKVVEKLLKSSQRFLDQGEEIIPGEFIEKLKNLLAESAKIFQKIKQLKSEKSELNNSIQMELYREDSRKLRSLYSWALMIWEQDEPYLVQLGFAVKPRKRKHETEEEHEE
ncbi:MAG: hypothetical protein Q7J16_06970 [Candidatus Cloacimonadales bacterium]|nr:hypothetical protein [Candidatus Cloacimonadales bacterium]